MITEDKVTELFCMADDFCKFFDAMMEKYTLKSDKKRRYHRDTTMLKAEIMLIMIPFQDSGYRCLKHFYLEKVCKHLRHLFPKVVSYNRFVELEKEVAIPLALFIKKVLLGKCTGISFVDSTPLRVCRNQRIHIHKVFRGIAQRGKCSMGWCFDNFIVNLLGAIAAYCMFPKKPCINVQRTLYTQLSLFGIHRTHVIYCSPIEQSEQWTDSIHCNTNKTEYVVEQSLSPV